MKVSLSTMRLIATGALVFSIVAMGICRLFESSLPWLVWPRVFFEAATVGAAADWFAVVALFRHPMGIPIPHTAILPKNKDRVAESLSVFLETSFLTSQQLAPRLQQIDYAGFVARWMEDHADMLTAQIMRFLPALMERFPDEENAHFLAQRVRGFLSNMEMGTFAGNGLDILTQNGRDREIFRGVLKAMRQLMEEHQGTIHAKIREEIPISGDLFKAVPFGKELVAPLLDQIRESIASAVARKTIEKIRSTLDEAAREESSPLWISFDQHLRKLIGNLKTSPEMAARVRTMQTTLLESAIIDDFSTKTWQELKMFILNDCKSEQSLVRQKIHDVLHALSVQLATHNALRSGMNTFLGEQVLAGALSAKSQVRELVVSTIRTWDAKEMADRLEAAVGRDLQFIRLNGTIVGGLIGVMIYGFFRIFLM